MRILNAKKAAVLILIKPLNGDDFSIVLTKRTDRVDTHQGQIAFPGGMMDEGDQNDPIRTALREAEEEMGIPSVEVEILGTLPELLTVTQFQVTPVVGLWKGSKDFNFRPAEEEVATWFWAQYSELERVYQTEEIEWTGKKVPIHVFQVGPFRIWGATGSMLRNLLDRLK